MMNEENENTVIVSKTCTTCLKEKPLTDFRRQSKNKDGLKYTCKECDDKRARMRYKTKKTKILSQVKEWQSKNPERVKFYKRKYRNKKSKLSRG